MACLINRNQNGKITSVLAPNGQKSKLFESIHSNPFMADAETSVNVLKNAYTEDIKSMYENTDKNVYDTGEPQLFYRAENNEVYEDIEELIINNPLGKVTTGFVNPKTDAFIPTSEFNMEASQRSQFVYNGIAEGTLSPKRVIMPDGTTRLQGKGEYTEVRKTMAQAAKFDAISDFGIGNIKVYDDGTLSLPLDENFVTRVTQDGHKVIRTEDIDKEVDPSDENFSDLLAIHIQRKYQNLNDKDKSTSDFNEKEVLSKFSAFLRDLGFSTTTIQKYKERYKTKHGQDPDIQALADMTNKVVALSQGVINIEDLSEEVAHIAIEYYADQNSIASAIASAHLTPEYKEYSEYYRGKYSAVKNEDGSNKYEGAALEEQVRKEILGKVLKNEFLNRFSTENQTVERRTLVEKIREFFDNFVNYISQVVGVSQINNLEKLNQTIADAVLNNRMDDFNVDQFSDNIFYSAQSQESKVIESQIKEARRRIENLFNNVLQQTTPNKSELETISENMSELKMLSSVNTMAGIAEQQVKVLKAAIQDSKRNQTPLSEMNQARAAQLSNGLMPALQSIRSSLDSVKSSSKENLQLYKMIEETIDETEKELAKIRPNLDNFLEERVDQMVEEEFAKNPSLEYGQAKERKEETKNKLKAIGKDISMLAYKFGLPSQSRNPIIALVAKKAMDMTHKVSFKALPIINKVVKNVAQKGLEKYQKDIIAKDKDGKNTSYFDSPFDWAARDKDLEENEQKWVSEITNTPIKEVKEKWKGSIADFITTDTDYKKYKEKLNKWKEQNSEFSTTDAYRKEKEERYKKANVSEYTQETISNKNTNLNERNRKYRTESGSIDNSLKSEEDKQQDRNDLAAHRQAKNPYYKGVLREGLKVAKFSELTEEDKKKIPKDILPILEDPNFMGDVILPDENNTIEDLIEDTRQVIDLFNLDMLYRKESKEKSKTNNPTEEFENTIKEKEKQEGSAYEWVLSNSTITLNDKFYEDLGTGFKGYLDVAQEFIDDIDDPDVKRQKQFLLEELKDLQKAKKSILKQSRKPGNPIENDAFNMGASRKVVIQLESDIESVKSQINVDPEYFDGLDFDSQTSTRTVNEDFELMFKQSDAKTEYEFSLDHMTESNRQKVTMFAKNIDNYLKNKDVFIGTEAEQFIEEVNDSGLIFRKEQELGRELTVKELSQIYKDEFAKRKVSSYFQRFEPKGYRDIIEAMKSGELSIHEFLTNRESIEQQFEGAEYIDIRPDYTWTQDINNEKFRNPNYINDEYYDIPKLDKWVNKKWFDKFGVDFEEWKKNPTMDLNKIKATKNLEEFELLKTVISLREETLEEYGDTRKVNKFLRPQISKTGLEKIGGAVRFKKETWKDIAKDIYQDRIDVKEHGELVDEDDLASTGDRDNIKIIPKYFQHKLEDPGQLTDNVIQAALIDRREAILYRERKAAENDFNALLHMQREQMFKSDGLSRNRQKIVKKGQTSNYYKLLEDYTDYVLYGIKQSRRMNMNVGGKNVDITRVVNAIQSWTRFSNLAFHPIVDATSAATGSVVNLVDRLAGDYYHTSSATRALTLSDEVFKYIAEEGKLDKSSELNHLLELYGVEDVDDRIKNSAFGRGMRLLDSSPYLLSKISNMGIKPRVLFAVLTDVRYIDGKFMSWDQFYSLRVNQIREKNANRDASEKISVSRKAIEAEFKKAAKESLYDHLEITKQGISFNNKFKEKFPENTKEEFDRINLDVASRTKIVVQQVDTVISKDDQIAAQRDVITNGLMMHKGWMPINLTRAFKQRHYNFTVGKFEEGRYITLFRFFKDALKNKQEVIKNPVEYFKHIRNTATTNEKENYRRIIAETSIYSAMIALGYLIFAADDDDDSYIEDLAQYTFLRTSSEYNSSNIFGIGKSLVETAKSPLAAIKTVEYLEPVTFVENFGGVLAYPFYEGEVKEKAGKDVWKFTKALTPLKRIEQMSDIQKQIGTYWYYNRKTIPFRKPE